MSKDTGGSAFPKVAYKEPVGGGVHVMVVEGGMTLRDYFAAKAMQGFMANKENPMKFQPQEDAEWAYKIADAMIAERNKA